MLSLLLAAIVIAAVPQDTRAPSRAQTAQVDALAALRDVSNRVERLNAQTLELARLVHGLAVQLGSRDPDGGLDYENGLEDGRRSCERTIAELEARVAQLEQLVARYRRALGDGPPPVDEGGDEGGDEPPSSGAWASPLERIEPARPRILDGEARPGAYRLAGGEWLPSSSPASELYRLIQAQPGHSGEVSIGVRGAIGRVAIGTSWSSSDPALIVSDSVDVVFVGLDENATLGPLEVGSRFCDVARAAFFDLGIRGAPDTFAVRQVWPVGQLDFVGFWVVPDPAVAQYASLFHLAGGWDSLTLEGFESRGLTEREHVFYLKPGGRTQVLDCELVGGNRCGVHVRSHGPSSDGKYAASPRPSGPILIEGNHADGFGWEHANADGGSWITVYSSLENVVAIRGNDLEDGRYGGILVSQGVPYTGPYLTDDGYSHSEVWIEGNTFRAPRGDRMVAGISAAREVHLAGENVIEGGNQALVWWPQWEQTYTSARPVGSIAVHGADAVPSCPSVTWDVAAKAYKPLPLAPFVIPEVPR